MKKIVIFGVTGYAQMLYFYEAVELKNNVIGFTLNEEYITGTENLPAPLMPFEQIEPDDDISVLIGIGYNEMNLIRESIYNQLKDRGFNIETFIHPTAYVANNAVIGEGSIILEKTVIQPFVEMGVCNICWSNVNISHHTKIGDFNFFGTMSSFSGGCVIKNNCFFGTNSTVKNGIFVAPYTLVGAGAYISKNTNDYDVYSVPNAKLRNKLSTEYHKI